MNNALKNALFITTGIVIGGGAGYVVTKKMLETKFEIELDEQIRDVKEYYKLLRKEGEYSEMLKPEEPNYQEMIQTYQAEEVEEAEEFEEAEEVEETEEVEERNTDRPYVITVAEFMQERDNYDKNTVTYYEEDNVLCDEREQPIADIPNTISYDALTKFGEGSGDTKVVYVRNERMEADFEVILDVRSYAETILGFKEEKEVRRMREDD